MKNQRLLLLDIDGMFYHACADSLEESIIKFKEKLQNCLDKTECTHWAGFVGKGKCFRYNIFPEYKGNRTQYPPKFLSTLKEWAIAEFNLNICSKYEADDAVAYWYNKNLHIAEDGKIEPKDIFDGALEFCKDESLEEFTYVPIEVVIASPDKDILQSIEGKHFNYSYKITDEAKAKSKVEPDYRTTDDDVIRGWWVETNREETDFFIWKQVLMGDDADAIKGLSKVGKVTANKWLMETKEDYSKFTLGKYIDHYENKAQGIFEFQKNYRLLHLLNCDEDFIREVGELPYSPHINEVTPKVPLVEFTLDF